MLFKWNKMITILCVFIMIMGVCSGVYAETPVEVIIDNDTPGYVLKTDANYTVNNYTPTNYGGTHVWTGDYATSGVTITPNNLKPSIYNVSVWRPHVSSPSSTNMHADITCVGGEVKRVNYSMRDGSTGWLSLGAFQLDAGCVVKLSASENVPRYDAVRFLEVDPTPPQAQLTSSHLKHITKQLCYWML